MEKTVSTNLEEEIKVDVLKISVMNHQKKEIMYRPIDYDVFAENYKFEEKLIYSNGLSPSIVHMGVEVKTGNRVAIKELKKEKLKDDFMKEMIKNELSIHHFLSKISNNIVKVKDYAENEKSFYLVMECSDEPNFFEDLLENRYCPVSDERTLKAFALDVLTGLKEIHKFNIIHCDIKPQNFLLFKNHGLDEELNSDDDEYYENYYLKITDFGFAHRIPDGQTKVFLKYPCGTFSYIAPEITKVFSHF